MKHTRTLWTLTVLLTAIGVAIVIRRMTALYLTAPGDPAAIDAAFSRHRLLTTLHILPGLIFVLVGPLQFVRNQRARRPALHRWSGRVFVAAGLATGVTALAMGSQTAIGGAAETAAT